MRERPERVESPCAFVTECVSRMPSLALVVITWRGEGCGWDKQKGATTENYGSGVKYMG